MSEPGNSFRASVLGAPISIALRSSLTPEDEESGKNGTRPHLLNELLAGASSGSPYLKRLIEREAEFLAGAIDALPEDTFADLLEAVGDAERSANAEALMSALRTLKARSALFIALCDLGGVWPLERVLRALTDFADKCTEACLNWLLADVAEKGTLGLDPNSPAAGSDLFVIAMGKGGARELNYSSDIDLILFFDHADRDPANYGERKQAFNRLTRRFVKIMQESTPDGYVFRTDLRLRPDPASTAACMSTDAAARYYESFGKNWERAAYIKARIVAGDRDAGQAFLEQMQPFIWRRHLDFAAIEDVRDIKRLIHQHKGHGEIRSAGHNIKLGRGGIREIEFFAQTQQLIAGGRDPSLRVSKTLEALKALADGGWIAETARSEMHESYEFLRRLENRLQMVEDRQTHTLPTQPEELERLAAFCGFRDFADLDQELRAHLGRVSERFDALFEDSQTEPDAADNLSGRTFADPAAAEATIARWRDGSIAATRTERAKSILDRLVPRLLAEFGDAGDPDRALVEFDRFLSGLPSGVQILSLFEANPALLDFLTKICALAPRLADYLGRNASVLDAVLWRGFFSPVSKSELLEGHAEAIAPASAEADFEEILNASRRWSKEQHFRIGAQLLTGTTLPPEVGEAYSELAEVCIAGLAPEITGQLAPRHGPVPGVGACVVAMGRLGAREMTAGSDLDLLVIYDDGGAVASNGPSSISPTQYYARWTQRLVRALTAPTSEGAVYEVDMRLRPSGRAGPLATRIESFERYQASEAWTWEHMALTRARVVSGPEELRQRIEEAILRVLSAPRERSVVLKDALEMRGRQIGVDPAASADPWNVKMARGGLVDCDFIIQAELLSHGLGGAKAQESDAAIELLAERGALTPALANQLREARALQMTIMQLTRLSESGRFDPETAPPALKSLIASALAVPDFARAEALLSETQASIRDMFVETFGGLLPPADGA